MSSILPVSPRPHTFPKGPTLNNAGQVGTQVQITQVSRYDCAGQAGQTVACKLWYD